MSNHASLTLTEGSLVSHQTPDSPQDDVAFASPGRQQARDFTPILFTDKVN